MPPSQENIIKQQRQIYEEHLDKKLQENPAYIKDIVEKSPLLQKKYRALSFARHQIYQPITLLYGYVKDMPKLLGIEKQREKIYGAALFLKDAMDFLGDGEIKRRMVFERQPMLKAALRRVNPFLAAREKENFSLTYEEVIGLYFDALLKGCGRLEDLCKAEKYSADREKYITTLKTRLAFYKAYLTSGEINLETKDIDKAEIRQLVSDSIGSSSVEIVFKDREGPEALDRVGGGRTNGILLMEAISNILLNVDRHKKPGDKKGKVTVAMSELEEDNQQYLLISFTDNGIGIPPGEEKRIFEFGLRGSNVNESGEGIGLHSSREMIRMMGGEMWATSPGKDQGSTFYIRLPAAKT